MMRVYLVDFYYIRYERRGLHPGVVNMMSSSAMSPVASEPITPWNMNRYGCELSGIFNLA